MTSCSDVYDVSGPLLLVGCQL